MRCPRKQSGFALLLVLIFMAIGSIVAVTYVSTSTLRTTAGLNLTRFTRCRYLAEAGVANGAYMLRNDVSALLGSTLAVPFGPYTIDDENGTFSFWGEATGTPDEYVLYGQGDYEGMTKVVSALASLEETFSPTIMDHNPVGYWRLEETSGSVCRDSMGDYHGTYQNGPTLGATGALGGSGGNAVSFDGLNDCVEVGEEMQVSGDKLTVLAWVKGSSTGSSVDIIADQSIPGGMILWGMGTLAGAGGRTLVFAVRVGEVTKALVGDIALQQNEWHFCAAVYDGAEIILYIDAEEAGRLAATGDLATDDTAEVWIGAYPNVSPQLPWYGTLDEVAVLDKALTQEEIEALFEARLPTVAWREWND